MKRPAAREAYEYNSGRASENVRQLAFAALAVVWLFKPEQSLAFPTQFIWAGTCAIAALALDFLQYICATVIWGSFHRHKEKAGVDELTDFKAPDWFNRVTNTFFALKCSAVVVCYILLLSHMTALISTQRP